MPLTKQQALDKAEELNSDLRRKEENAEQKRAALRLLEEECRLLNTRIEHYRAIAEEIS